jgi:quinol monooxygenase YgiN
MIAKMVRFTVRPEEVETCRAAIERFVVAVGEKERGTLLYTSYSLPDGVSFIHWMEFTDAEAESFHQRTEHVKEFVRVLYPRCVTPPEFTELRRVAASS